jgi:chemotaxis signal transduction protein
VSAARSAARQVLTVRVGEERIDLPAGAVSEVIRSRVLTRVPHAPPSLLGVTNLRGAVLPVVSLAGLLGRETAGVSSRTRIVVMNGAAAVGLLVDEVRSLRAVPCERQHGGPSGSGPSGDQDASARAPGSKRAHMRPSLLISERCSTASSLASAPAGRQELRRPGGALLTPFHKLKATKSRSWCSMSRVRISLFPWRRCARFRPFRWRRRSGRLAMTPCWVLYPWRYAAAAGLGASLARLL